MKFLLPIYIWPRGRQEKGEFLSGQQLGFRAPPGGGGGVPTPLTAEFLSEVSPAVTVRSSSPATPVVSKPKKKIRAASPRVPRTACQFYQKKKFRARQAARAMNRRYGHLPCAMRMCHEHPACAASMPHEHAPCACAMRMRHERAPRACAMSMRHEHVPCATSMCHEHVPCAMSMCHAPWACAMRHAPCAMRHARVPCAMSMRHAP